MIPHVTLNVDAPQGFVIFVGLAVVVVCLALFGLEVYKAQVLIEDYERVVDDADKGVRGVERHDVELAELREEVTRAMLDHCERLDALEEPPAVTEPVRIPTVEAAAAIDEWHALTTRRPVPYRRGDA